MLGELMVVMKTGRVKTIEKYLLIDNKRNWSILHMRLYITNIYKTHTY